MEQSSPARPRKSIRLTPGQHQKLVRALQDLQVLYQDVVNSWAHIPPIYRAEILEHSPILRAYAEFFKQVDDGQHSI